MNWQKKQIKILIDTIVITLTTFIVTNLLINNLSEAISIDPTEKKADIEFEDIYNRVANNRAVQSFNPNIVIIGVDSCSRSDIASLIDAVSYAEPRVIGLDVFFEFPGKDDDMLISAISDCDNIVLPLRMDYDIETDNFINTQGSFFYSSLDDATYGVVNFPSDKSSVLRKFRPIFTTDSDSIDSFAAAIALKVCNDSYIHLINRNNNLENINFFATEFAEYDAFEIIDEKRFPRQGIEKIIHDKIVLIGGLNIATDKHITPVDNSMSGVKVHAKIIDTIIGKRYIRHSHHAIDLLISFIFCFLFAYINLCSKQSEKWNNIESLLIRILQLGLVYILLVIGCRWFIKYNISINFSCTLLMICNTAIITDIWLGIKELYTKRSYTKSLFKRITNKTKKSKK